ncbi:YbcC family protein [Marinibaculum pumilum]|uniref:Probable inorganic carbon transporter subunit DabA n=1 Tax=Marinibaculum pumilum TaxID=1766165 RepID=A0ABV7KZA7_9PROT
MFQNKMQIAPARASGILAAAERAAHAIPPAFPLDATVAVNPFVGQADEDLATAAARLGRVAGVALTRPRAAFLAEIAAGRISDDDLSEALAACTSPLRPASVAALKAAASAPHPPVQALPTVAELAAGASGTDWPSVIAKSFGLWAAGHFDRGQALWSPAPGQDSYAAWQAWASVDLTPEIAGLDGFCAHVAAAPDTPERAILRAAERLGIDEAAAETVFHRLLMELGGWAQHARWLLWRAEQAAGSDTAIAGLLAARLVWEEALLAAVPQAAADWTGALAGHAAPVVPNADHVVDEILQTAAERAYQHRLDDALAAPVPRHSRPALQAAFCIDVRSEVFRRALEAQDPGIDTIGFAGFFGLPLAHRPHGSELEEAHLPVLLQPALHSESSAPEAAERATRIAARTLRAWGRFRQAAVSSFAFVEAAGPFYGAKLVADALGLGHRREKAQPAPRLDPALSPEAKARTAATVLKAMGLTAGHAPLVLLLGHGAQVTNNPHESAYHCGACGGHTGEVSARLLALLLNDPDARAGLPAHGIALPADTRFLAGLHDTTTDQVMLYDTEGAGDLTQARDWLSAAGARARAERALRLPGATAGTVAARALNWAEVRPEWGLADCAAFIAAPRSVTAGASFDGRTFLHSYDWETDEGFATLELILTAPVVVASWISLQYYGSTVAPQAFGGGNKLLHNVTGGIGVVEGNGGTLRPGLPWQAVSDGAAPVHTPLRLSVLVEAPQHAILDILDRHPQVRALFDNGWLHLLALRQGRIAARYQAGLTWAEAPAVELAA